MRITPEVQGIARALDPSEEYWFLAPCCGESSSIIEQVLVDLDVAGRCIAANRELHTFLFKPLLFAFIPFDLVQAEELSAALTVAAGYPHSLVRIELVHNENPVEQTPIPELPVIGMVGVFNSDHDTILGRAILHVFMDELVTEVLWLMYQSVSLQEDQHA